MGGGAARNGNGAKKRTARRAVGWLGGVRNLGEAFSFVAGVGESKLCVCVQPRLLLGVVDFAVVVLAALVFANKNRGIQTRFVRLRVRPKGVHTSVRTG